VALGVSALHLEDVADAVWLHHLAAVEPKVLVIRTKYPQRPTVRPKGEA
jgi:hypothetical protein